MSNYFTLQQWQRNKKEDDFRPIVELGEARPSWDVRCTTVSVMYYCYAENESIASKEFEGMKIEQKQKSSVYYAQPWV